MDIQIKKFGDVLVSRPAGREAFLLAESYVLNTLTPTENIDLYFDDVKVLAPSWADEFVKGIKSAHGNSINFFNTSNPSVAASLKAVLN